MCNDCIEKAKKHLEENNNMVQNRIERGLSLQNKHGVMGIIGHINFGVTCEHEYLLKKTDKK